MKVRPVLPGKDPNATPVTSTIPGVKDRVNSKAPRSRASVMATSIVKLSDGLTVRVGG